VKVRPYVGFSDQELQQLLAEYAAFGSTRKIDDVMDEIRERVGASDTTLAISEDFRLIVKRPKLGQEKVQVFGI
jgi:hypothetical protein